MIAEGAIQRDAFLLRTLSGNGIVIGWYSEESAKRRRRRNALYVLKLSGKENRGI